MIRIGRRSTNDYLKKFNFHQLYSDVTDEEKPPTDELTRTSEEYGKEKSNQTLQQTQHINEQIDELEASLSLGSGSVFPVYESTRIQVGYKDRIYDGITKSDG